MKLRHLGWTLLALIVLAAVCAGALVAMNLRGEDPLPEQAQAFEATPQQVERGRYLALAGNCAGCHTTRGGQPYAGGLPLETPFGTIYSSNLTSDTKAGIGGWSSAHFWRAMHNGRSKDGRLLYPAFPYPNFTKVTREDSDAIYAYLRTVAPAPAPNLAHRLRFPYDTQAALAVWRALSFKPEAFVANAGKPAEWNRGAYLVDGLGHCIACHGTRNSLGATETKLGLSGGLIAVENWYAPSLTDKRQAGVAGWPTADVVALLKTGTAPGGSVMGPMADVVFRSTQHLSEADLTAMAGYLKDLPDVPKPDEPARTSTPIRRDAGTMARGGKIYDQRCAYCHGDQGQGATGAYPPLAGNRAVNMSPPTNLIQVVSHGGFLPSTAGNPRPYGMPPFGQVLDAAEVAAVLTYIRGSWGNDSAPVTQLDTMRR
ncbi:mono/diheme cytochrome c family protein [Variovorax boronicumulans]|uniref:Mono/diheme cytochrome c family protein n=1 Tax=Variovorax boronicumulans TaxID=436515 RepID=A0AAW8D3Y8_9BURK|nr:cytochrome c [Variovorax boronicumulans]MDP9895184.1 mono/diheme cytochrome c family protein [Variovorax boronicumulans]MDQ0055002.1 mono/diheme cytochrome c family protein [Variovorax boronicumulans]